MILDKPGKRAGQRGKTDWRNKRGPRRKTLGCCFEMTWRQRGINQETEKGRDESGTGDPTRGKQSLAGSLRAGFWQNRW